MFIAPRISRSYIRDIEKDAVIEIISHSKVSRTTCSRPVMQTKKFLERRLNRPPYKRRQRKNFRITTHGNLQL